MLKVTQQAEKNCFNMDVGSSNTLSAQPGSVPHPSFWLTFNIVSPGCEWLPVGPAHCHSETTSCAVCMPATCLPAFAAHHTHLMSFSSCVTKPGQSAHSSPTPGHSDWVRMGPWTATWPVTLLGLGGSLQPLGRNVVSTEEGSQGRKDTTTQDQCPSPCWMSPGLLVTWPITSLCCWYQLEQSFTCCNSQVHKHYLETKSYLGSVNYSSSDQGCQLNHNPPNPPTFKSVLIFKCI